MPNHIIEANERFCRAIDAADAAGVAAVYAPDAHLLAPGSPALHGREAIESFWKAGIAAGVTSATLETVSVVERDDLAIEVGSYRLTIRPLEGDEVIDLGKYCVVHQRDHHGRWAWAVDAFNSNAPAS